MDSKTHCTDSGVRAEQHTPSIVGMAARTPGRCFSAAQFFQALKEGRDLLAPPLPGRWDLEAVTAELAAADHWLPQRIGMLDTIFDFDNKFFNISNKEARSMDPQQKMLLEIVYEALEDAGMDPLTLAGSCSKVGVFVGSMTYDYKHLQIQDPVFIDAYTETGTEPSILANRVSFFYNFHGPSVSVNTACSSSLTAFCIAMNSLMLGECDMAIVAGTTAILEIADTAGLSCMHVLSPNGVESPFSKDANGYVRSEGAIALVMTKAQSEHVYARVRGWRINHDGRKTSLTTPNPAAQEVLMREMCAAAAVDPACIDYVEAHGTGTPTGDPLESKAISQALNTANRRNPIRVGSVKGNVGHGEGISGLTSIVKVAMQLKYATLAPSIHCEPFNPSIPFDKYNLKVQNILEAWPAPDQGRARLGLVNSFGFGGANATVLLEEVPTVGVEDKTETSEAQDQENTKTLILPLSAASSFSINKYAASLASAVTAEQLSQACLLQGTKRHHFDTRACVVAQAAQMHTALMDLEKCSSVIRGDRKFSSSKKTLVAFVFSGQGTQWPRMGVALFHEMEVFRNTVLLCDSYLQELLGWSLLKDHGMFTTGCSLTDAELATKPLVAMPAIVFTQLALTDLFKSWGVRPSYIVGHSLGEISAGYASGKLTLKQAVTIACGRAKLMAGVNNPLLGMAAIGASAAKVQELIASLGYTDEHDVCVSALNSPEDATVSGRKTVLNILVSACKERGWFAKELAVSTAFHSIHMQPIMGETMAALVNLGAVPRVDPSAQNLPRFFSSAFGHEYDGALNGDYWYHNIRGAVRFSEALACVPPEEDTQVVAVEIGSHAALLSYVKKIHPSWLAFGACKRNSNDVEGVLKVAGALYSNGVDLEWSRIFQISSPVPWTPLLPTYAWEHDPKVRLIKEAALEPMYLRTKSKSKASDDPCSFVDGGLTVSSSSKVTLTQDKTGYVREHVVGEDSVVPFALYLSVLTRALQLASPDKPQIIHDLVVQTPVVWPKAEPALTYDVASLAISGNRKFSFKRQDSVCAEALACTSAAAKAAHLTTAPALSDVMKRCSLPVKHADIYAIFGRMGLNYGPHFSKLETIFLGSGECLGRVSNDRFPKLQTFDPAILDCCIQSYLGAVGITSDPYLPKSVAVVEFAPRPAGPTPKVLYCHVITVKKDLEQLELDMNIYDEDGAVIAVIRGFLATRLARTRKDMISHVYTSVFQPASSAGVLVSWSDLETVVSADAASRLVRVLRVSSENVLDLPWLNKATVVTCTPEQLADSSYELLLRPASFDYVLCDGVDERLPALVVPGGYLCDTKTQTVRRLTPPAADITLDTPVVVTSAGDSAVATALISAASSAGYKHVHVTPVTSSNVSAQLDALTGKALVLSVCTSSDAESIATAVALVNECARRQHRLVLVTDDTDPASRMFVCLPRTARNEMPDAHVYCVSMTNTTHADKAFSYATGAVLPLEMYPEIVLEGNGQIKVEKLIQIAKSEAKTCSDSPYRIWFSSPGQLIYQGIRVPEPGPQDVLLHVEAVGLNFKDVLLSLGVLPGFTLANLGLECVGVVESVGSGVSKYSKGQRLVGLSAARGGVMASHVVINADMCVPVPSCMSPAEAAGQFTVWMTVVQGLVNRARLSSADTILVHAAAGGVGFAAVLLAKKIGAKVIATVSESKREWLRSKTGLEHITNSRDPQEFTRYVLEVTHGKGVDVVLNSLSGEALVASMKVLAPSGRFVEIGKADMLQQTQLDMHALLQDITFISNQLDLLSVHKPEVCRDIMSQVHRMFENHEIEAIPVTVIPVAEAASAFRDMANARHKGKLILDLSTPIPRLDEPAGPFSSNRTYVITGGLSGIGLELASYLTSHGVMSLVLVARRPPSDDVIKTLDHMRHKHVGLDLTTSVCDACDAAQAHTLLTSTTHPVGGVFHLATVYNDKLCRNVSFADVALGLAPKVTGTLNLLHNLSNDAFLMCTSSASTHVGTVGQTVYAAANGFLIGLAERNKTGPRVLALVLPLVTGCGHAAELSNLREFLALEDQGVQSSEVRAVLEFMVSTLVMPGSVFLYDESNHGELVRSFKRGLGLRTTHLIQPETKQSVSLVSATLDKTEFVNKAKAELGRILSMPSDTIATDERITRYGLDSLGAIELSHWLSNELSCKISQMELLTGMNIDNLWTAYSKAKSV